MKTVLTAACAALALLFSVGAAAAPPGDPASITLDQAAPAYGDTVTFTTVVPKLKGWQIPRVVVRCFQDVNADTVIDHDPLGADIVYARVENLGVPFILSGGESGPGWPGWPGGAAECDADLTTYGWNRYWTSDRIATTSFSVTA